MEGAVNAGAPFVALAAAPTILTTTSYGLSSASSSLAKAYSIPGAQQAAKTLSQASGSALSGSSAITNFFNAPMPGTSPIFCRYCSRAELEAIQETGYLRGGRLGETYFTTDNYSSALRAQEKLSLKNTPEIKVTFSILNSPTIFGPRSVFPDNGQPGVV